MVESGDPAPEGESGARSPPFAGLPADSGKQIQRLAERAAGGDAAALDELLHRIQNTVEVWVVCADLSGLPRDQEDIAQDALLAISSSITSYDPGVRPFLHWAYRVTRHRISDWIRSQRAEMRNPARLRFSQDLDSLSSPEDLLERIHQDDLMRRVMIFLSDQEGPEQIRMLRSWASHGPSGAAREMGMLESTLRSRVQKLLARIACFLGRRSIRLDPDTGVPPATVFPAAGERPSD